MILEEFIEKFFIYAYKIAYDKSVFSYKRKDDNIIRSSAYEALQIAFDKIIVQSVESEKLQTGIVKCWTKWVLRKNALKERWIWDKRHTFAPVDGVFYSLEDWFASNNAPSFCVHDLNSLICSKIFTETQNKFIEYTIKGYTCKEISEITGFGMRHIHKTLQSLESCLKHKREVEFSFPKKWGIIGPKKVRNK